MNGALNDSWEYAAGINWFLRGHANRFTFDVTRLAGNIPAENSGPGYQVGMDGVMVRTQWQIAF